MLGKIVALVFGTFDLLFGSIQWFDKLSMLLNGQITGAEWVLSLATGTEVIDMIDLVAMSRCPLVAQS